MAEHIVKDFYVYLHRRATDGRVFYVGKGAGRRAWRKKGRSIFWGRIAKKYGVVVEIAQDGLQEWAAFELECGLIAYYGKEQLCNLTDGGEGVGQVNKGKKLTEQHKKKVSLGLMGHKISEESKKKMSAAKVGRCLTQEHKDKIGLASRRAGLEGRKKFKRGQLLQHVETGFVFKSCSNARRWASDYFGVATSSAGISTALKLNKPYKGLNFVKVESSCAKV